VRHSLVTYSSLTLPHPTCEVRVLKRYGMGDGEARGRFELLFFLAAKTSRGLEASRGRSRSTNSAPPKHLTILPAILLPERLRTTSIRLLAAISESKPFPGCHKKLARPLNGSLNGNLIRPYPLTYAHSSLRLLFLLQNIDIWNLQLTKFSIFSPLDLRSWSVCAPSIFVRIC
jgi:hypothetical protein